jgi:hypothetical protein
MQTTGSRLTMLSGLWVVHKQLASKYDEIKFQDEALDYTFSVQNANGFVRLNALAKAQLELEGTTPVRNLHDGTTPMGLWILVEYPPTITITAKS